MRTICALTNRIVPTTSNNPIPTVIHVRNPQARQVRLGSGDVDRWVAEAGLEVQVCDDVYRGLARIIGTRDDRLRAVVVCVDDLRADEFEFFTLIARYRRDVSVYVYGGDRVSSRVTRAMELGATGEATEAVIRSLKTETHEGTVKDSHEATLPGQAPPRSHEEVNEEESPAIESPAGEQKESSDGVRVPWLRYGDRPARRGPESRGADGAPADFPYANAPGTSPDATLSPQPSPWKGERDITTPSSQPSPRMVEGGLAYEPLLTEAELEALMNEDFDEFDPGGIDRGALDRDEREMLTGDEAAGEGGRR